MKRGEGGKGSSTVATSVNCGAHYAPSCEECPQVIIENKTSLLIILMIDRYDNHDLVMIMIFMIILMIVIIIFFPPRAMGRTGATECVFGRRRNAPKSENLTNKKVKVDLREMSKRN